MSSTQTFNFEFKTGPELEIVQAVTTIYGLSEGTPEHLFTRSSSGDPFSLNLSTDGSRFYCAVTAVNEYAWMGRSSSAEGRKLQFLAVFDSETKIVGLGERPTIANNWCFARFTTSDGNHIPMISASEKQLGIMLGMKNNLCLPSGEISQVISRQPNGLATNSFALFNFLSNLLYYCIADPATGARFISLALPEEPDATVLEAFRKLVYRPFTEVSAIYRLISERLQPFLPSLPGDDQLPLKSHQPDQWTLTVKVNDSGAQNFLFAGPANIAFDIDGRAWVTNNVRQGTPNSSTWCMALNPDGTPAPFSPIFGGGLLGVGFAVTIDAAGETIYFGNYGWGASENNPETGGIAIFSKDGRALSPSQGYTNGLMRVQGMAFDNSGNLWIGSWGNQTPMGQSGTNAFASTNSSVVVYLNADPEQALSYVFDSPYYAPFGVVADGENNVYVSNAGNSDEGVPSSVYKFRLEAGQIVVKAAWISDYPDPSGNNAAGMEAFRQINLNRKGEIFVAGAISNRIVKLDNNLNKLKTFTHLLSAPWGINFDAEGTIFASNFSKEPESGQPRPNGVTVIRNEDDGSSQLMTLPSGGEAVILANGKPLYGNEGLPCYDPLMRLTATQTDCVGNLWAMNNWKPVAPIDLTSNPGGDGIVIFIGVSAVDAKH